MWAKYVSKNAMLKKFKNEWPLSYCFERDKHALTFKTSFQFQLSSPTSSTLGSMPKTVDYFTHPERREYSSVESIIPRTRIASNDVNSATAYFSIPKPVENQDIIADECSSAIAELSALENETHFNQYADFNKEASQSARTALKNSQDAFLADKLRLELGKLQRDVDTRNYGWTVRPWRQVEGMPNLKSLL